ncbi:MAG: response regulator transcription factor [Gammaproteobacteria bacterium]|nr:response regulator transcription factor [Gammaproteobacteria bacterium]
MSTIRVLLADDHALVRNGIRMLLQRIDNVEVIAETGDGHQALALVESLRPDVALIDISMPGMNGIETVARIRARFPETRTVILSMHAEEEFVSQALKSGALGYLLKDATPAELELAIKAAVHGEIYLSPRISGIVVEKYVRLGGTDTGPLHLLTDRQREVLRLLAEGHSTKQIAAHLGVSIKTVETHRAMLMDRLGIRELAGLVRLAVRTGLVPGDR